MSFTTENLIAEIEKRPAIWNMKISEYRDKNIRKRCWEEVTKCFSKEGCSEKEKNSLNSLLQKKWKNIRDRFNREIIEKIKSKDGSGRKVPYMYSRQLQFLSDTLVCRKTPNSLLSEMTVCEDNDTSLSLPSISTDALEEATKSPPRKRSKLNNHQVEKKIMEVLDQNMKERAEIAKKLQEKEMTQDQDTERLFSLSLLPTLKSMKEMTQDQDAERLFLLSLLPTLKSIDPNFLLKAKIAIMNALDGFPKTKISNPSNEQNSLEILPTE